MAGRLLGCRCERTVSQCSISYRRGNTQHITRNGLWSGKSGQRRFREESQRLIRYSRVPSYTNELFFSVIRGHWGAMSRFREM